MTATNIIVVLLLFCIDGCGKSSAHTGAPPVLKTVGSGAHPAAEKSHFAETADAASAPRPSPATKSNPFHPDDDPACGDLSTLMSAVHMWQVAASPQPHRRKVVELWPTVSPVCRGGTFYLVAAELVGRSPDAALATADGAVVVHSPAEALARGFAVEQDHPRVLAHLAFADDVAPGQPPALPAGACASARNRGDAWIDYTAYVCALAAIHAGDGVAALPELERIRYPGAFPDLQLRRAQALALAGKREEAHALVKPATAALAHATPRFDLTSAVIAVLKKKLVAL